MTFKTVKNISESSGGVHIEKNIGAYHSWQLVFRNPVDFTREIRQISPMKSTQNLIKASVSAKTLQFDEYRVGAMTKDFM